MKKTVLGVLAAAIVLMGLLVAPPAQAGPYTGTVATKTTITAVRTPIASRTNAIVRAKVAPRSGSVAARGAVRVICRTIYKGNLERRVGASVRYRGPGVVRIIGPRLIAKQNWNCYVRFGGGTSVFAGSQAGPVRVRVR